MRSKSRVPKARRRQSGLGHRQPQPGPQAASAASLHERVAARGLTTIPGGATPSPRRPARQPSARERVAAGIAQRQILDTINAGFARIDATLRLGLGIDDQGSQIEDLEQQLSDAQAKIEELTIALMEATGEDAGEDLEPVADGGDVEEPEGDEPEGEALEGDELEGDEPAEAG